MSLCEHLDICAFYNDRIEGIPNEGVFFKQLYCRNKSDKCARAKMSGIRDVRDTSNTTTPIGIDYSGVTSHMS